MRSTFIVLMVFLASSAWAAEEKLNYIAPSQLANTTRQMGSAGFWINRHPAPDELIMNAQEIGALNSRIQHDLKLTKDIFASTADLKTDSLVADFDKTLADYTEKGYYTAQGVRNDAAYIDKARQNMYLPGVVAGMAPRYGLVVRYADVRFFPTEQGLYETQGDFDFDQVQNSSFDVGTPVAVVHQSKDKKWYYVLSALSDGWVKVENIAIGDMKTVKEYADPKETAVVIRPKAEIYLNESMTEYADSARMGTRLPYVESVGGKTKVLVPTRDKSGQLKVVRGFVDRAEVRKGYLPYTARSIYRQAFAMLNQPYGWGGMYGQQDCSAFLDEVFATVGIILPRDSKNQAVIKDAAAEFDDRTPVDERLEALHKVASPGTILAMKGHILLYVGQINDRPYAIHAAWAYREKDRKSDRDVPRVMNRVVVSDLYLGEGSHKGSLLKRLTKIVEVK